MKSYVGLALAGLLVTAIPATAQQGGSPYEARYQPPVSVRAEVFANYDWLLARNSFDALLGGKHTSVSSQGGFEFHLRNGIFWEITGASESLEGQQAFYADGVVYRVGVPLTIKLQPIELTAGYRFRRGGRFIPYAGAGFVSMGFEQKTVGNDATENVKLRKNGYLVKGGLEVRMFPWVSLGAEVARVSVKGILGDGGLSQVFGENDIGNTSAHVKVMVGR